jgi:hypothetical protein
MEGMGALHTEPTSILYLIMMKPKMGTWHCCNSLCTASSTTQKKQTQKKPKANNHETKGCGEKKIKTQLTI